MSPSITSASTTFFGHPNPTRETLAFFFSPLLFVAFPAAAFWTSLQFSGLEIARWWWWWWCSLRRDDDDDDGAFLRRGGVVPPVVVVVVVKVLIVAKVAKVVLLTKFKENKRSGDLFLPPFFSFVQIIRLRRQIKP
jgi:hypothetical protein